MEKTSLPTSRWNVYFDAIADFFDKKGLQSLTADEWLELTNVLETVEVEYVLNPHSSILKTLYVMDFWIVPLVDHLRTIRGLNCV